MTDINTSAPPVETAAAVAPSSASVVPAVSESAPTLAEAVAAGPLTSAPSEPATAPIEAAKAESVAPTTLLAAEALKAEQKPVDKAPDPKTDVPVEQKKEDAPQSDDPAPLPSYEAFTLPEGIALDEAKLGEFTKELGELQATTKADQSLIQQFGQKLIDRHVAEVQDSVKRVADLYQQSWEKQKSDWKDAFENDPVIGGQNRDQTLNSAIQFIRTHGGNAEQQKQFNELMEATGLGNNPVMIRLLAQAGTNMSEGKPLPATKPVAQTAQSKVQRRYGGAT